MYVIIPAYRPDRQMREVVFWLLRGSDYTIIIVDDGSGSDYAPVFDEFSNAEAFGNRVVVLRHEVNRGKGCAMKTAFAYIAGIAPDDEGVVTVDADGQHLVPDIENVIRAWQSHPESLVLGGRRFTGKVPLHNRMGNAITRGVFAFTTGTRVYDTQTGLRAFSVERIEEMLQIKGDRYEYEINQLLYATKYSIDIIEIPIETVYIGSNKSSHYRVVVDSWRIYKMILVFMLSSFSCFLIDYGCLLLFAAVLKHFPSVVQVENGYRLAMFNMLVDTHLIALVCARIISSLCNYILNRRIVFKSRSGSSIFRYYTVIILLLAANYGLLKLFSAPNMLPLAFAQLVVQAILYPCSFILQRIFVFPTKERSKK